MLRKRLENLCKENIISEFGVAQEESRRIDNEIRDENSPFRKLNTALMRLRSEMVSEFAFLSSLGNKFCHYNFQEVPVLEYRYIAIIPRSTVICSGSTC